MTCSKRLLGSIAKVAGATASGYGFNQKMGFENPHLLVTLPSSIVGSAAKDLFAMPKHFDFNNDPLRAQLHEVCNGANLFDRLTVPPVNGYLANAGVPLGHAAFKAIVDDIEHTKGIKPFQEPLHSTVQKFYEQSAHQSKIAKEFTAEGEKEGGFLHGGLAVAFLAKATLADAAVRHVEAADTTNMSPFNP